MSIHHVKLPDVGEGVAEAELVEWLVAVGDPVTDETALAEVLTDKTTIEITSPVVGTVRALEGEPGDVIAVGSVLVDIEVSGGEGTSGDDEEVDDDEEMDEAEEVVDAAAPQMPAIDDHRAGVTAAPAVRARASALGIDLGSVPGSGPSGRVLHGDLDAHLVVGRETAAAPAAPRGHADVQPIRGLRRRIAERLSLASTEIPHITYVDEVDATQLEKLRRTLNERSDGTPHLTLLPFVAAAIVVACRDQPRLNAHYDGEAQELTVHPSVDVGIATQTPEGLVVPVLRDAGHRALGQLAGEVRRLATAAREGTATREELTGSTITITSLGAMGGLVTTPIINHPEVAIVGVNKLQVRPVWADGAFVPRSMFNLSCSFDHRIVDGWDAAVFVQRIKSALELPALLFEGARSR